MPTPEELLTQAADEAVAATQIATEWANRPAGWFSATESGPLPSIKEFVAQQQAKFEQAIYNTGWFPADGSFEFGGTITARNQVLFNDADGSFYSWSGALPKVVPAASTPASTGGISANAWVNRGDGALRSALAAPDSTVAVGGVAAGEITQRLADAEQRIIDLPDEVDAAGTAENLVNAHNSDAGAHPELSEFITTEANRAETAASNAVVNAQVFTSISDGIAATSDPDQFAVINGNQINRYKNNAGVAEYLTAYPSASFVRDNLDYEFDSRGQTTVSAGSVISTTTAVILDARPIDGDGVLSSITLSASVDGSAYVHVYITDGTTANRIVRSEIAVTAGINTYNLRNLNIVVQSGNLIGVSGNGVLLRTNVAPVNDYYNIADSDTVSMPTASSAARFEFKIDIDKTVGLRQRASELGARIDDVNNDVVSGFGRTFEIGADTIGNGTQTSTSAAVVLSSVTVPFATNLSQIELQAAASGVVFLHVYRPVSSAAPGVTVNRITRTELTVTAGLNTIDLTSYDLSVLTGDLVGMSGNGVMRRTTGAATEPYYVIGDTSAATLPATATSARFEFIIYGGADYDDTTSIGETVKQLRQDVDNIIDTGVVLDPTESFLLLFLAGQSNMAGRDTAPSQYTIPAGRGYKYDPATTSLVHLTEPTGTDTTALTGRTSIGSALARTILQQTNGRIGAIIVNTGIGGTTISTWQSGGSSWTAAVTKYNLAIADVVAKKLNIAGCAMVWCLGETDGNNATDPVTYATNLENVRDQAVALTGISNLPVVVIQTGVRTTDVANVDWQAIRNAQATVCRDVDGFFMGYDGAKHFAERGLMIDTLHYSASAMDEIGRSIAGCVLQNALGKRPVGLD